MSATSPDLPGFVFARPTVTEGRRDLYAALDDVGLQYPREMHIQRRGIAPDGAEYVIRRTDRTHAEERLELEARLLVHMAADGWSTRRFVTDETGVVVFICAVLSDS